MIELWWATVKAVRRDHRALLDEDEQERLLTLRFPADRERFLTGAVLARLVAGRRTGVPAQRLVVDRGCDHCPRPHGRPRLRDGGGPVWSVSHSGDHVVVAVADATPGGGLGVDLERIDPDRAPPADLVLSRGERRDGADLWRTWVRKEAVLKASGDGLQRAMTSLTSVEPWPGSRARRVAVAGRPDLTADVVDLGAPGGYVGALAVLGSLRPSRPSGLEVRHRDAMTLLDAPVPEEISCR